MPIIDRVRQEVALAGVSIYWGLLGACRWYCGWALIPNNKDRMMADVDAAVAALACDVKSFGEQMAKLNASLMILSELLSERSRNREASPERPNGSTADCANLPRFEPGARPAHL